MEIKNVTDAILDRRSHRKYKPEQISEEQLNAVLKAFDWAPTARNAQELRAIVIQDAAVLSAFAADFEAFCEQQEGRMFKNFYYSAPTFVILVGPKSFPFTMIDSGIAVENMAIAAEGIGLGSVIIGCLREYLAADASAAWRERFGITDEETFTIGIVLGLPDSEPAAPARNEGKIVRL